MSEKLLHILWKLPDFLPTICGVNAGDAPCSSASRKSALNQYLQIAHNRREGKRVKQTTIATLGRLDKLAASGAIDQLLRSAARFAERVMVLAEHTSTAHDAPDAKVLSIGPALIFERLWRETGSQEVVRQLLASRHHHFDVERAVFMTVLHRLMVSGSDRSALQWRRDQAIDGTEALELQHLYRAMGWLGEALGESEPDAAPSPRRTKDLIEEELFARRRDLFSALDLVFFDTTSLFFTGNGGETLGQYGKSKDHRSDCKQMVLGMVIDGDGIPVCSEMWPGNTTDVTTLDRVAGRLQCRFGVRRVCLVADAGMISKNHRILIGPRPARRRASLDGCLRGMYECVEGVLGRNFRAQRGVGRVSERDCVPATEPSIARLRRYGKRRWDALHGGPLPSLHSSC